MPKPVKKKKPAKPSTDPNRRAHQMLSQHLALTEDTTVTPPHGDTFEAQLSAHMAKLGAKGGTVSGARRMENLSAKKRKEIAKLAAAARWKKARG